MLYLQMQSNLSPDNSKVYDKMITTFSKEKREQKYLQSFLEDHGKTTQKLYPDKNFMSREERAPLRMTVLGT